MKDTEAAYVTARDELKQARADLKAEEEALLEGRKTQSLKRGERIRLDEIRLKHDIGTKRRTLDAARADRNVAKSRLGVRMTQIGTEEQLVAEEQVDREMKWIEREVRGEVAPVNELADEILEDLLADIPENFFEGTGDEDIGVMWERGAEPTAGVWEGIKRIAQSLRDPFMVRELALHHGTIEKAGAAADEAMRAALSGGFRIANAEQLKPMLRSIVSSIGAAQEGQTLTEADYDRMLDDILSGRLEATEPWVRRVVVAATQHLGVVTVDWRGQWMQPGHVDSIYAAARLIRSKLQENLVYFLLKEGRVVDHQVVSSGSLVAVAPTAEQEAWINRRAAETGAGEIVVVHNHPSGNTRPSTGDISYSFGLRRRLGGRLKASVWVIDSNEMTEITQYGGARRVETQQKFDKPDPVVPSFALGDDSHTKGSYSRQDLAQYAMEQRPGEGTVLVGLGTNGQVYTLSPANGLDVTKIDRAWLEDYAHRYGLSKVVMVVTDAATYDSARSQAEETGILTERADGMSRNLDILMADPAGGRVQVATTTRPYLGPRSMTRRSRPLADLVDAARVLNPSPAVNLEQDAGRWRDTTDGGIGTLGELGDDLMWVTDPVELTDRLTALRGALTRLEAGPRSLADDVRVDSLAAIVRAGISQLPRTKPQIRQRLKTQIRKLDALLRRVKVNELRAALIDADIAAMRTGHLDTLRAAFSGYDLTGARIPRAIQNRLRIEEAGKRPKLRILAPETLDLLTQAVRSGAHVNRTENITLGGETTEQLSKLDTTIAEEITSRTKKLPQGSWRSFFGLLSAGGGKVKGKRRRGPLAILRDYGAIPQVIMDNLSPTLREWVYRRVTVLAQNHELSLRNSWLDAFRDSYQQASGFPMGGWSLRVRKGKTLENWRTQALEVEVGDQRVEVIRDEAILLILQGMDPKNQKYLTENGFIIEREGAEQAYVWTPELDQRMRQLAGADAVRVAEQLFDLWHGPIAQSLVQANMDLTGKQQGSGVERLPRETGRKREGDDKWKPPLKVIDGGAAPYMMRHLMASARRAAYAVPARDAFRVLEGKQTERALRNVLGDGGYEMIRRGLQMQTDPSIGDTIEEGAFRRYLRRLSTAALGIRPQTMMFNPAGIAITATRYTEGESAPLIVKALAKLGISQRADLSRAFTVPKDVINNAEWRRAHETARQWSPYWRTRYEFDFVHEVTLGLAASTSAFGPRNPLINFEWALGGIEFTDRFGGVVRWLWAEDLVAQRGVERGTPEFYEAVNLEWMEMMFRGENSSHGGDMTGAIQAGRGNALIGALVLFSSSSSKVFSQIANAGYAWKRSTVTEDPEEAAAARAEATRAALWASISLGWVAAIRLSFAMGGGKLALAALEDDDEEPEFGEPPEREGVAGEVVSELAGQLFGGMFGEAIGTLPLGGALRPIGAQLSGRPATIYPVAVHEATLRDALSATLSGMRAIEHWVGEDYTTRGDPAYIADLQRAVRNAASAAADLTGVPLSGMEQVADVGRHLILDPLRPDDAAGLITDVVRADPGADERASIRSRLRGALRHDDRSLFNRQQDAIREYNTGRDDSGRIKPETIRQWAISNPRYGPSGRFLERYLPGGAEYEGLTGSQRTEFRNLYDERAEVDRRSIEWAYSLPMSVFYPPE